MNPKITKPCKVAEFKPLVPCEQSSIDAVNMSAPQEERNLYASKRHCHGAQWLLLFSCDFCTGLGAISYLSSLNLFVFNLSWNLKGDVASTCILSQWPWCVCFCVVVELLCSPSNVRSTAPHREQWRWSSSFLIRPGSGLSPASAPVRMRAPCVACATLRASL